jgi:hypothetical protein
LRFKPGNPSPPILRINQRKPSILLLRLNHETHASHLHVYGADRTRRHSTSRSPGHRVPNLCDHLRSSVPGLLLLPQSSSLHVMPPLPPAHNETSKHDSPHDTRIKVKQPKCLGFEFKHRQVNNLSQSNQGADHLVSHFCNASSMYFTTTVNS